jgi:hypothetical protein
VKHILELIFKGLFQWLYSLILEGVEYLANQMLGVFSMDMAFFESSLPAVSDVVNIAAASGWALLLGNFVFQAAKSMMSGLGFEADDPKELFARTFVFGFALLASRQICDIGLGLSSSLIELLQIPDAVNVTIPDENAFAIGASWLLVIIIGLVLMWQLVKLFLAVGERYFLVGLLTILAPWAFAMGGSRGTSDIFKGWLRMFASMCLMMVLNVIILKLFISAMGHMPPGPECVPWVILIVAIARVGKKIDGIVTKIGLSPSVTGGGGRSLPGMLTYMVARNVISKTVSSAGGGAGASGAEASRGGDGASNYSSYSNNASSPRGSTSRNSSKSSTRGNASARAPSGVHSGQTRTAPATPGGGAGTAYNPLNSSADNSASAQSGDQNAQTNVSGNAGTSESPASAQSRNQSAPVQHGAERKTSAAAKAGGAQNAQKLQGFPGTAKKPVDVYYSEPRGGNIGGGAGKSAAGNQSSPTTTPSKDAGASKTRFTAIPPGTRKASDARAAPGAAGTGARNPPGGANISSRGNSANTQSSGVGAHQSESRRDRYSASEIATVKAGSELSPPQSPGVAGISPNPTTGAATQRETRKNAHGADRASSGSEQRPQANTHPHPNVSQSATAPRERAPRPAENPSPARKAQPDAQGAAGTSPPVPLRPSGKSDQTADAGQARRSSANTQPPTQFPAQSVVPRAAPPETAPRKPESPRQTRSIPGAAGTASPISGKSSKPSPPYTPRQPIGKGAAKPGNPTAPRNNGKGRKKKHRRDHK